MTLVDAGPLVALVDAGEPDHDRCVEALGSVRLPMVTTWPALTEAMHLVGRAGGWTAQRMLWKLVQNGDLEIGANPSESVERMADLMARYSDRPMDLADASLVVLAEARGLKQVFTLDSDFDVYRRHGRGRFQLLPGRSHRG